MQDTPPQPAQQPSQSAAPLADTLTLSDLKDFDPIESLGADWHGILDALANLMTANRVLPSHIEKISSEVFRYFPAGMPIANYPPDFVQGVLIGAWAQVFGMIQENRKLPFE